MTAGPQGNYAPMTAAPSGSYGPPGSSDAGAPGMMAPGYGPGNMAAPGGYGSEPGYGMTGSPPNRGSSIANQGYGPAPGYGPGNDLGAGPGYGSARARNPPGYAPDYGPGHRTRSRHGQGAGYRPRPRLRSRLTDPARAMGLRPGLDRETPPRGGGPASERAAARGSLVQLWAFRGRGYGGGPLGYEEPGYGPGQAFGPGNEFGPGEDFGPGPRRTRRTRGAATVRSRTMAMGRLRATARAAATGPMAITARAATSAPCRNSVPACGRGMGRVRARTVRRRAMSPATDPLLAALLDSGRVPASDRAWVGATVRVPARDPGPPTAREPECAPDPARPRRAPVQDSVPDGVRDPVSVRASAPIVNSGPVTCRAAAAEAGSARVPGRAVMGRAALARADSDREATGLESVPRDPARVPRGTKATDPTHRVPDFPATAVTRDSCRAVQRNAGSLVLPASFSGQIKQRGGHRRRCHGTALPQH